MYTVHAQCTCIHTIFYSLKGYYNSCLHSFVRLHVCVCAHACLHACMIVLSACMHAYMHTIHIHIMFLHCYYSNLAVFLTWIRNFFFWCVLAHACMHACVCKYIHSSSYTFRMYFSMKFSWFSIRMFMFVGLGVRKFMRMRARARASKRMHTLP